MMSIKRISKGLWIALIVGFTFLATSATPLSQEMKAAVLQNIYKELHLVRAFDFNCEKCTERIKNSESIASAKTRYEFVTAVNEILESSGVTHFALTDRLLFFDFEFLEEWGMLKRLCSDEVMPTCLTAKIFKIRDKRTNSRSKVLCITNVSPTMVLSPVRKGDVILKVSDPLEIRRGLIIWGFYQFSSNRTFDEALQLGKVKLFPIKESRDIQVPKGKIRFAIYQRKEDSSLSSCVLWPHVPSLPSQELCWIGNEPRIPFCRISGFSQIPDSESRVSGYGQYLMWKVHTQNAFQSILSYDRESMRNILAQVKDSPYLILDLRNNGGGSISEFTFLATYGFGAPAPFVECIIPDRNTVLPPEEFSYQAAKEDVRKHLLRKSNSLAEAVHLRSTRKIGSIFQGIIGPSWQEYFDVYKGKVAILVNKDTFSAGEGFVYQLREGLGPERCVVIGAKTAGGGVGEVNHSLCHDFYMRVPGMELMPMIGSLNRLEGVGVSPDIVVDDPASAAFTVHPETDRCIQAAVEWLKEGTK